VIFLKIDISQVSVAGYRCYSIVLRLTLWMIF